MDTRITLAAFHQERAQELYEVAHWVAGKAIRENRDNYNILRRNQYNLEADLAAKHARTARILMGVEDA